MAELAGSRCSNIDQEQKIADIPTAQDTVISEVNQELNDNFLAWADSDPQGKGRKLEQGRNAQAISCITMRDRILAKIMPQIVLPEIWWMR